MLKLQFLIGLFVLIISNTYSQSLLSVEKGKVATFQKQIDDFYNFVQQMHYKPRAIDDEFSKITFAKFIESLDPSRIYFFQSDVDEFKQKYQYQVDELLLGNGGNLTDLVFIEEINNRLNERKKNILSEVESIITQEHNYEVSESYRPYSPYRKWDTPYPNDFSEQKDHWRKMIKYKLVNGIASGSEEQEIKNSLVELYKTINSEKNYNSFEDTVGEFLRAVGIGFDPHNSFMSMAELQAMRDGLSSSLIGIGSVVGLTESGQYIVLRKIIPGSPAEKAGLKDNDIITSVKEQGQAAVDISFKELTEMVNLIKGAEDSVVEFTIKRKEEDGETKELKISVVRKRIENTTANYARVKIIGKVNPVSKTVSRIAVIKVPSFYYDKDTGEGLTSDTRKILEKLNQLPDDMKVHGLVIDLMDNGGGYLHEATSFTGLFIKNGPVVIERYRNARRNKTGRDSDSKIYYDGPLVVLINEYSASASEIFAGAIQDYQRGLIVGSNHSFGKGTIQGAFDKTLPTYGFAAKVTVGKYFRITGGSNQHSGVSSDIEIPTAALYPSLEKDYETSLKNDEIVEGAYFTKHNEYYPIALQLEELKTKSSERICSDREFILLEESKQRALEGRKEKGYSLKLSEIKAKEEETTKRTKDIRELRRSTRYHANYVEILSFTRTKLEELYAQEEKEKGKSTVKVPNIWEHEAVSIATDLSKIFDSSSREVSQNYLNHLWSSNGNVFHIEDLMN